MRNRSIGDPALPHTSALDTVEQHSDVCAEKKKLSKLPLPLADSYKQSLADNIGKLWMELRKKCLQKIDARRRLRTAFSELICDQLSLNKLIFT